MTGELSHNDKSSETGWPAEIDARENDEGMFFISAMRLLAAGRQAEVWNSYSSSGRWAASVYTDMVVNLLRDQNVKAFCILLSEMTDEGDKVQMEKVINGHLLDGKYSAN